jgi:hypothetical protein
MRRPPLLPGMADAMRRRPEPPPPVLPPLPAGRVHRFRYYLGAHRPGWVSSPEMSTVPLFVSWQQIASVARSGRGERARTRWALDSGGFTELSNNGRWTVPAREYARGVERLQRDLGGLEWAAVQDWMCEPEILKNTGLSVEEHQRRTVASFLELRDLAPGVPWVPVLQGWSTWGDHLRHVELYEQAGVDLWAQPVVGVGSICRRSDTARAQMMLAELADLGLPLHAFGFKIDGLLAEVMVRRPFGVQLDRPAFMPLWSVLASADSMAWSFAARMQSALQGCTHRVCNNCPRFAREWRVELLQRAAEAVEAPMRGLAGVEWPLVEVG